MLNYIAVNHFDVINLKFSSGRVVSYWNKLSSDVKSFRSADFLKVKLEQFKIDSIKGNATCTGQIWELSEVLGHIEGTSYLENKVVHINEYLKLNPFVAKKKFINIH